MSLILFLVVLDLFLFFAANYVLSAERNPRYQILMEESNVADDDRVPIVVAGINITAVILLLGLIATVPFLRFIGALLMVGYVANCLIRNYLERSTRFSPVQGHGTAAQPPGTENNAGSDSTRHGQAVAPSTETHPQP
jgi:hypothetical protein